ncbi:MAG: antibiotic biosynthesis monooxygenase family protein [Blastocatellia bacterium]
MFIILWQYRVRSELASDFERLYGPDGVWAQLFRLGEGYLGTELLRDRNDASRYLTVDRWVSRESYEAFRTARSDEYLAIDRETERLTLDEQLIGSFELLGATVSNCSPTTASADCSLSSD